MSSNVGLSTPRGSGTSGYVQRNLSTLKSSRQTPYPPRDFDNSDSSKSSFRQRQPDKAILAHDRKREIEVKVFELRERLEDEGVEEGVVEERTEKLRGELLRELEEGGKRNGLAAKGKGLKRHQVHELAEAKIEESERFRRAVGIRGEPDEGAYWDKGPRDRLRGAVDDGKVAEKGERKDMEGR